MRIAFVVNRIDTECVDYTTTHLAMEGVTQGHEIWYINISDFSYAPDEHILARALKPKLNVYESATAFLDELQSRQVMWEQVSLDTFDIIFLRNDPSEDTMSRPWARLAGINFGRLATRHGVIVLNDPVGLLQAVNKMYLQYFPEKIRPKTLISRDKEQIKAFIHTMGGFGVLKPIAGSGGRNVFLVRPEDSPNVNQMIEAVSRDGYVIAQEYLPEANRGDIRLFLMNGQPLELDGKYAAFRRVRKEGDGDMRSNMTAGAISEKVDITPEILEIAELIRPKLIEDGMFLVGIDIVGDKVLELNVFSPGGLFSAARFEGVNFHRIIIEALERKVDYVKHYPLDFDNVKLATL